MVELNLPRYSIKYPERTYVSLINKIHLDSVCPLHNKTPWTRKYTTINFLFMMEPFVQLSFIVKHNRFY